MPMPRITGPDGAPANLAPAGPPRTLDGFNFRYHLSGNPQPAKTANIMVPRPKPKG